MEIDQKDLFAIIVKNFESLRFCSDMLKMVYAKNQIITPITMDAFLSSYRMLIATNTLMDLYIERYQGGEEMIEIQKKFSGYIKGIEDSLKDCFINYSFFLKQPRK